MRSACGRSTRRTLGSKRLLVDTMLDNAGLKDLLSKNGDARCETASGRPSPSNAGDERAAGVHGRRGGPHEHAVSLVRGDDGDLRSRLHELARQRLRFGYRRLHIPLRRDGITINRKKTQRLYREENFTVCRHRSRTYRAWSSC